jgi:hypothetical protein
MKCIRCEILRAKLRAILYKNMRWSVEELVDDLNAGLPGVYYCNRHEGGAEVYRESDVVGSPAILIASFR